VPYTASYTVNPNCTGKSIYPWDMEFDLFIDPGGERFTWVLTVPDDSPGLSGVEQRVTRERIV
jgi:hypothetical protein